MRWTSAPDPWRLLVRIAGVRWVAIALAVSYAVMGRQAQTSPAWLAAGIAVATTLNLLVAVSARRPLLRPRPMAIATLVGDYAWITVAAAVIATGADDLTAVIGYVVLASECGLLMGWRGALGALVAAAAGMVGLETLHAHLLAGGAAVAQQLAYEGGAVAVSAVFAAVAAAELRRQQDELVAQSARLASHARTDHLTGLGNAVALREGVEALRASPYAMLLVDVDGLRAANTVYGHQAGDEMLLGVARVLAAMRSCTDLAVRIAEDKFALLLPGGGAERAAAVAEEVRLAMHGVAVSAGELRVCVGTAWSSGGDGYDAVMARADDALYAAKAHGGDRVVTQGEASGGGRWRWRAAVESVLGSERGVYAVYQAIVRVGDGATAGWEALSRPRDWPSDASVEGMFLTAHRMGRGRDLDWRCRRAALWEASRLAGDLFVNVNLAALADPVHDVDQMLMLCDWATRDPRSVVLELSERDAVPDLRRLRGVLAEYRAAGFRVAVDDVGQGQTTLELLLATRPEFLKLAQPLVQAARSDTTAYSAARALVGFSHDIGAAVIAEGVEDEDDFSLCTELRIDLVQGWLFGRPQPAELLPS